MRFGKATNAIQQILIIILSFATIILSCVIYSQSQQIEGLTPRTGEDVGIGNILEEEIIAAKYFSTDPNDTYEVTDLSQAAELLSTLDEAIFYRTSPPGGYGLIATGYMTAVIRIETSEHVYIIGSQDGAFYISVDNESSHYRCTKETEFLEKINEIWNRNREKA